MKLHRARVLRIQRQQINHRFPCRHHRIALAVDHDAVAHFDREVEAAIGGGIAGHGGQKVGHHRRPFQRPANGQKLPARRAIHVFMHQSGKAADLAQQHRHDQCGILTFCGGPGNSRHGFLQILQRRPAIDRKPVADIAGTIDSRCDGAFQRGGDRLVQGDPVVFQPVPDQFQQRFRCRFIQTTMIGADQAQDAFGPLDIAAQPEQIVRRPGGQGSGFGADERRIGPRQHAGRIDRCVADHPDIGHRPAVAHRDRGIVPGLADAAKAALHRLPAIGGAGQKYPDRHWPGHQCPVLIDRGGRQGHQFLAHQIAGIGLEPFMQIGVVAALHDPTDGMHRPGFVGHARAQCRPDDHFMGFGGHMIPLGLLPAPPCGDIRQRQGPTGQHL